MKRYHFLEKRRTWALVLMSILLPPMLVLGFPRANYMEDFQLISERIYRTTSAGTAAPARKDVTAELVALQDSYDFAILSSALRSITQNTYRNSPILAAAPSARTLNDCVAARVAEPISKYAQIASSGVIDFPFAPSAGLAGMVEMFFTGQGSPSFSINYSAPQEFAQFSTILACDAFSKGDTTQAVALLKKGMDVLRPFPWYGRLTGARVLPVLRYWLGAVSEGSDCDAIRKALARMGEGPARQPVISYVPEFTPVAAFFANPWITRTVQTQAMASLAKEVVWMKHEENRAWAASMDSSRRTEYRSRMRITEELLPFPIWTITHMQQRKIEHIVRTEPELAWKRLGRPEVFAGVNSVSAALFPYFGAQASANTANAERVQLTEKALIQLGCATYDFRREHGRWPNDISELPEISLGGVPGIDTSAGRDRSFNLLDKAEMAYGPITLGEREVTTDTLAARLNLPSLSAWQLFPYYTATERDSSETSKTFDIEVIYDMHQANNAAFPAWLLGELLQQHRQARVTTMTLTVASVSGSPEPVVSAAQAFALSSGYNWPSEFVECRNQAAAALSGKGEPSVEAQEVKHGMKRVVLRATVQVPRKAFAIHSYGPNGIPGDFHNRQIETSDLTDFEEDQILFLN